MTTDDIQRVRRARFGCLAEGCDEQRDTCGQIDRHIESAHPELWEPGHEECR